MKSQPTLSIAMATYNGEAHILEQLASIAGQSVLPAELVICDDQSTDATVDIVSQFARAAPFPVYFQVNEDRLGYGRNFIKAASLCRGDFISFSDQDDVWESSKIAETLSFFATSRDLLVAHDFSVFFADAQRPDIPSYFSFLRQSGLAEVIALKGCTLTMRKDLIARVGWPPAALQHRWGHDNWICLVANLLECQEILRKPLIRHRIHGANTSGALWGGRDRIRRLLRSLHLPPFTSRHALDAYFSYYFSSGGEDIYHDAIEQCAAAMSDRQYRQARQAYANRVAYLQFPSLTAYGVPRQRALAALRLFAKGIYRDGDGFLGLVQDLFGDRKGRF